MSLLDFTLFETPLGVAAVAWRGHEIVAVQLPEPSADETRRMIGKRHETAVEAEPPRRIVEAIAAMTTLLRGELINLDFIDVDLGAVTEFARNVYAATRAIQPGSTATYGEIAARIGEAGEARAVGQALGRNPVPIIVPCHRVLGSNGKVGGFSAAGGVETKMRMLTIERARTSDIPTLFDGSDWPLAARRS